MIARALALCLIAAPLPGLAAPTLSLPEGAVKSGGSVTPLDGFALPLGPWQNGVLPTREVSGQVNRSAWQIAGIETTMQLYAGLRAQLVDEGFVPLFECETNGCGGFDFRYGIEVLPEPQMHVDLGDFHYLSAERTAEAGPEVVTLLVSRSSLHGFVELTRVGAAEARPIALAAAVAAVTDAAAAPLGEALERDGAVALDDLVFETGAAQLGGGDFASLHALADYLESHPGAIVTLVGHTDAEGSLAANITLSEKRARSVADRLITEFGANPAQLSADGVGYLAPRASNLSEEGRRKNRRVEAILASTR
ncbi:OmpA family protein [Albidovulum sediminicola]|uniref:OmpA family protein n=1 Tax=Albidovulum sediminicola TaxID=2984331 RepID=A0ABT2YZB6_9RHOB|nr:OmpA family protein [Defluviimonas sp. WL0075]MCV2864112.1 OmpA family protein [Defluviimonas sp. WL0075]